MRYSLLTGFLALAFVVQSATESLSKPKAITITIKVITNSQPPVGVAAKIWRKVSAAEDQVAETDGTGVATVTLENCSPDVQFRAEVLSKIRYRNLMKWEPCNIVTGSIEFFVWSTGVSRNAESVLKGELPDGWSAPKEYGPLFIDLQKAANAEQWGVVAKLSSQLSNQYRAAGLPAEANTLAELSLFGALAPALPDTDLSGPFVITKDIDSAWGGFVHLSPNGKKVVAAVQDSCGLPGDGIVGWKTMSCLPGGASYSLPDASLTQMNAKDFLSGT